MVEGYTYHLTHRCHDRRFLLKFSKERDAYREWLRIGSVRYRVPVYGYCVTHNHTHVIVHARDPQAVGRLMQLPSGSVARQLNERKRHEGAVWEHPYQCTMVEDGRHLLNCLRYVDLNMVRCSAVRHPGDWRWCSYDELAGERKRYRVIDIDGLLERLDLNSPEELKSLYEEGLREKIARRELKREAHWTEALAVGSRDFIKAARSNYMHRRIFEENAILSDGTNESWVLKESPESYMVNFGSKSAF